MPDITFSSNGEEMRMRLHRMQESPLSVDGMHAEEASNLLL
jgi:hypothetical protein